MKITITIELGHIVNDNGTVELKTTDDELYYEEPTTTDDLDLMIEDQLNDELSGLGFEPATITTDWNT